jgi:hypothetical protein
MGGHDVEFRWIRSISTPTTATFGRAVKRAAVKRFTTGCDVALLSWLLSRGYTLTEVAQRWLSWPTVGRSPSSTAN